MNSPYTSSFEYGNAIIIEKDKWYNGRIISYIHPFRYTAITTIEKDKWYDSRMIPYIHPFGHTAMTTIELDNWCDNNGLPCTYFPLIENNIKIEPNKPTPHIKFI